MPAGTPRDVIARLNAAFNKTMADADVKKQLVEAGYEIVGGEPEAFSVFVEKELAKWGPVVKKAKVQAE